MNENTILFRGKLTSSDDWVYGFYIHRPQPVCIGHSHPYCIWIPASDPDDTTKIAEVDPETVGQFTGVFDSNNDRIFEGDIILHKSGIEECDCMSVVKIGKYSQDGSGGEYSPVECYGVYAEIYWHSTPDWVFEDYEPIKDFEKTMSLLELSGEIKVIGNIYDNPSILKEGNKLW